MVSMSKSTPDSLEIPSSKKVEHDNHDRLPGAFKTVGQAFSLLIRRSEIVLVMFIVLSPLGLLFGLSMIQGLNFLPSVKVDKSIIVIIGFILVVFLFIPLVNAIALQSMRNNQVESGFVKTMRESLKVILPLFWVSTLWFLVITGAFVFFIIPGILMTVWLSLSYQVLINENITGIDALLKSREYTRGKFFYLLKCFLVYCLAAIAINVVLEAILMMMEKSGVDTATVEALDPTLSVLSDFVLFFLNYCLLAVIYENIVATTGDVTFVSTKKRKVKYILLMLVPLIFVFMLILAPLFWVYIFRIIYMISHVW